MKDSKKKGFTLIELLAVIIILAVIALIAVPLVMSTINDAKKGAAINSGYGYINALENSLAAKMIEDTNSDFRAGTYSAGKFYYQILEANGSTRDASIDLAVSYKGTDPDEINLTISEGVVAGGSLKIDGINLTVDANGSIKEGTSEGGSGGGTVAFGGTYIPAVEGTDTHLGIVYLDPTDLTAECDAAIAASNKTGTGYSSTGSGSNTAYIELEESTLNGTKDGCMKWYILGESIEGNTVRLISDHNVIAEASYDFGNKNGVDGNRDSDQHEADWELEQLTDSNGAAWLESLDPRLPTSQEIVTIGGISGWDDSSGSFFYFGGSTSARANYAWLYDNLTQSADNGGTTSDDAYYTCYVNVENTFKNKVYGYWTSTPRTGSTTEVGYVVNGGGLGTLSTGATGFGVRPVITISKSLIGMN